MSYSIYANFRTKATAVKHVKARSDVPDAVRTLIVDSVEGLQPDTDASIIMIKASGHQSHTITVEQHAFAT